MNAESGRLCAEGRGLLERLAKDGLTPDCHARLLKWMAEVGKLEFPAEPEADDRAALECLKEVSDGLAAWVAQTREEVGEALRRTRVGRRAMQAYQD